MPGKAGVYLTGYGTAECQRQNANGRTPEELSLFFMGIR
jgi:hypothetical protein